MVGATVINGAVGLEPCLWVHIQLACGCVSNLAAETEAPPTKRRVSFEHGVIKTSFACDDDEISMKQECWQSIARTDEVTQARREQASRCRARNPYVPTFTRMRGW